MSLLFVIILNIIITTLLIIFLSFQLSPWTLQIWRMGIFLFCYFQIFYKVINKWRIEIYKYILVYNLIATVDGLIGVALRYCHKHDVYYFALCSVLWNTLNKVIQPTKILYCLIGHAVKFHYASINTWVSEVQCSMKQFKKKCWCKNISNINKDLKSTQPATLHSNLGLRMVEWMTSLSKFNLYEAVKAR